MAELLRDPRSLDVPGGVEAPAIEATTLPDVLPPVAEGGEPLTACPSDVAELPIYALEGWPGAASTAWMRTTVSRRLEAAQRLLPKGYGLVVLDAWRSPELQAALYDHYYDGTDLEAGYVSRPDDPDRVPPHATGGAIDITLSWGDEPLALGTEFDSFDVRAWPHALEETGDEPARSLRRLLTDVLRRSGFTGYPLEWWHFSYGDQIWAHFYEKPHAIYGATSPPP